MPTNRRTYDAFFVNMEYGGTDTVTIGLEWLSNHGDARVEGLIHVPVKDQLTSSDLATVLGTASGPLGKGSPILLGGRRVYGSTERTFPPKGWSKGSVLTLWPTRDMIEKLHDDLRVTALCVVPWGLDDVTPWVTAVGARDLLNAAPVSQPASIADPVVLEAMKSLTNGVNLSTGLAHPRDKDSAVHAFRILRDGGHSWTADEIYAWALANGWRGPGAESLRAVAEGMLVGKRLRAGPRAWRVDILDYWRARANGEEASE